MTVVVVDDEPGILEAVEGRLQKEGYSVFTATTAEDGIRLFRKLRPDLMVVDVMLPQRSGLDLCRAVRRDSETPVIFLSARSSDEDRIAGLEAGGDDYVVKPFSLQELAIRVAKVLQRTRGFRTDQPLLLGNLRIDPRSHTAELDGRTLKLAPKEFALLHFLASHPGQVFRREQILDRVWGSDTYVTDRTVDVHVRWLRKLIEKDPSSPSRLVTVRGVGYRLLG
ncbi:MAG: response regulator transcription factor [Fimbriimonadaceae bacterium]|nr:response regulator transcription factor [Fimbriimonadaceae bacterium]